MLLQSVIAPTPGLGPLEWAAIFATIIAVAGIVYRAGLITARAQAAKDTAETDIDRLSHKVDDNLATILRRLDRLDEFNEEAQEMRMSWAAWRSETAARLSTVERELHAVRTAHDTSQAHAQGVTSDHGNRITRLEEDRRVGPKDRRHDP